MRWKSWTKPFLQRRKPFREGRSAILLFGAWKPAMLRNFPELLNAVGREFEAAGEVMDGHAASYRVVVEGRPQDLSLMLQDEVYRIVREVIRNAFTHAAASHIEVEIRYDRGSASLACPRRWQRDRSQDPGGRRTSGHFGIPGMRERAQRLVAIGVLERVGAGTEVQLTVPAAIAYEKRRHERRFLLFHWAGSDE